jgi:PAS domain S-box-containing protein
MALLSTIQKERAVVEEQAGERSVSRFEKLYTMLLDSIPSSVLLIDRNLRIVSANQNFVQKARVGGTQVVDRRLEEVFPPFFYQHMSLRTKVEEVFQTGRSIKGEHLVYRVSGVPPRYFYYSLLPFRWKGGMENVMLLMEDVTDLVRLGEEARRAERHLASVVESANDLVVSTDLKGQIVSWNTAAARVTGYEEAEVRLLNIAALCPETSRNDMSLILQRVPSEGRTEPVELELKSRQGVAIPISWVCSPMRDEAGNITGFVAVGRDLTERRKLQAQLFRSEKLAALGVMAGGIAHEIRNPLAVVSCAAEMILRSPLSRSDRNECSNKIYRNVQRASGIIESLLRFARPSDRGASLRRLDFVEVVHQGVNLVANQLKLSGIDLRAELPARSIVVSGNEDLLQQVVTNLLLNAANAMDDRGGKVTLEIEAKAGFVVLSVTDNGRGIPEGDLRNVFDPFFTTMPVGKGTGLGLSICYAIVNQHDGKIDVTSTAGQGTTITVSLPEEPHS